MKRLQKKDLVKLYEYAMRDGFFYSRVYPGSGYGKFIDEIMQKVRSSELPLDHAYQQIDGFVSPSSQAEEIATAGDI